MPSMEIAQLGAKVIRTVAEKVEDIHDEKLQDFIDRLLLTCKEAKGMGIAAPQVGVSKRLFILFSHPNERYPNAEYMEPIAIINPRIICYSNESNNAWEGCLSLPGIRAQVPRSDWIEVEYWTRDAQLLRRRFEGFLARVFLHEYDHLDGKVFIDRVVSTEDIVMEREYQRLHQHDV